MGSSGFAVMSFLVITFSSFSWRMAGPLLASSLTMSRSVIIPTIFISSFTTGILPMLCEAMRFIAVSTVSLG